MEKTETFSIAPVVRDEAHARAIEDAARRLERAKFATAEAAQAWDDECGLRVDERTGAGTDARHALREALAEWHAASEAFLRALCSGGAP